MQNLSKFENQFFTNTLTTGIVFNSQVPEVTQLEMDIMPVLNIKQDSSLRRLNAESVPIVPMNAELLNEQEQLIVDFEHVRVLEHHTQSAWNYIRSAMSRIHNVMQPKVTRTATMTLGTFPIECFKAITMSRLPKKQWFSATKHKSRGITVEHKLYTLRYDNKGLPYPSLDWNIRYELNGGWMCATTEEVDFIYDFFTASLSLKIKFKLFVFIPAHTIQGITIGFWQAV